jgi:hypothetical protein
VGEDDFLPAEKMVELIRDKIIYALSIYPKVSHSMLQVGIGTSMPPAIWRPVLEDLKRRGIVIERTVSAKSPAGRDQTHEILSLAPSQNDLSPEAENAFRLVQNV